MSEHGKNFANARLGNVDLSNVDLGNIPRKGRKKRVDKFSDYKETITGLPGEITFKVLAALDAAPKGKNVRVRIEEL